MKKGVNIDDFEAAVSEMSGAAVFFEVLRLPVKHIYGKYIETAAAGGYNVVMV